MAEQDPYFLERHPEETQRLGLQNRMFNSAVGYVLHPTIQHQLPATPKIAELATGTGAFLVDLSKQFSHASQLDGYDISNDAFLPQEELPEKISLSTMDSLQPAPPELHGKYDVVCIRFINVVLQPKDWKTVASHAAQLLKPGGAVQWIEGDLLQLMTILRAKPDVKTEVLEMAFRQALSRMRHFRWFVENLKEVLEGTGFRDVRHDVASTDRLPEDRGEINVVCTGAIYSILRRQAHSKGEGMPTEEEVEKWRKEMVVETQGGAYQRLAEKGGAGTTSPSPTQYVCRTQFDGDAEAARVWEQAVEQLQNKGAVFRNSDGKVVVFDDLEAVVQCGLLTYFTRPVQDAEEYVRSMSVGKWSDDVSVDGVVELVSRTATEMVPVAAGKIPATLEAFEEFFRCVEICEPYTSLRAPVALPQSVVQRPYEVVEYADEDWTMFARRQHDLEEAWDLSKNRVPYSYRLLENLAVAPWAVFRQSNGFTPVGSLRSTVSQRSKERWDDVVE